MSFIEILINYKQAFLSGLGVTLRLCAIVWLLGILVGTLLGVIGAKFKYARHVLRVISVLLSGVPIIVLLYWMYYPMQQSLAIDVDAFTVAAIAFTIVNVFLVSDLVRVAIIELPKQYITSAKVSGLSDSTILRKIQIPLIFKQVLGPVMIIQIAVLHNSIFASLINVDDIFRQIQRVNAMVYKPIELYSALALFFIVVTVPLTLAAEYVKRKYSRDYSER